MTSNEPVSTRILGSLRAADGAGVVRIEDRYDTGVTAIALWVGSEMILTLVILAIGIAIGGMFIAGGVWSIFANGGPHIIQAVIFIGFV